MNFCLATFLLACLSSSEEGVKLFSKPLGVTISTGLPMKCSHSFAVISLTVENTSAFFAETASNE